MLNRSILIGRLTKDPELRYSPNGTAIVNMTLAVDRPFAKGETDFIPIVVFKQQAESAANYLKKGRLCAVEGRIQTRNYDGKDGKKVYVTEIVADNVRFLEKADQQQKEVFEQGAPVEISDSDLPF